MSWTTVVTAFRFAGAPVKGSRADRPDRRDRPDRATKAKVLLSPLLVRAAGDPKRVTQTLNATLKDRNGPCVAHLRVAVAPAAAAPHATVVPLGDLIEPEQLRRGVVEGTGRLRLPHYALLCDIVEWLGLPPDEAPPLRDFCFARKRDRRPFLGRLWQLGGTQAEGAPGAFAFLWNLLSALFQLAPQSLWSRGLTRRLMRSGRRRHDWYRSALGDAAPIFGADFLTHAEDRVRVLLTGGGDAHDAPPVAQRQQELDRLLLHALLADLARWARPSRVAPWRRRRVTRFVLLLQLPREGMGAGNRFEHFFEVCASAVEATRCGAALWAAVAAEDAVLAGADATLAEAAQMLTARHGEVQGVVRPLRVHVPADASAPVPEPARRVIRSFPGPRAWAASELLAGAAIAAVVAVGLPGPGSGPGSSCLGGSAPSRVAASLTDPADADLLRLYREARTMIADQNTRADQAAAQGRTVQTIAYLGIPVGSDWDEERQRSDGAVPELRGIALAQRELNDEALSDLQKVWLRVELYDAGTFDSAPDAARAIVADAEAAPDELIGVVGIAQSWDSTREAVRVLSQAQIPVIATNATADEMQSGVYHHQIAPPSSREGEIASAFAHRARIVRDPSGGCAPADAAIVIQDPNDLYSESLGNSFARAFASDGAGGEVRRLWHSPDATAPRPVPPRGTTWEQNMHGVATAVCDRLRSAGDTRTVVYWAARSREFSAFLNDFEDSTACAGDPLTVVGGNGLSNPTLSGAFDNPAWLRLYHAAHVLPVGQSLSHIADGFNAAYAREYGADDPWRNDGHVALAYDTMQVMAEAANRAYGSTGGESVNRQSVQAMLNAGITKAGASGALDFPAGMPVSRDKPLVILYHTDAGSEPVLACGAFAPNDGVVTAWGPEGEFDCPRDD